MTEPTLTRGDTTDEPRGYITPEDEMRDAGFMRPEREGAPLVVAYHPDPQINAEVAQSAIEAERIDLAIGYPPRAWTCPCGAMHTRGHFGAIGVHRCLACGYVGAEGVMHGSALGGPHDPALTGDPS